MTVLTLLVFLLQTSGSEAPEPLQTALEQSEAFVQEGAFQKALELLQGIEAGQAPRDQQRLLHYRLGYLFRKQNELDQAVAWLSRAFSVAHIGQEDLDVRLRAGNLLVASLLSTQNLEQAAKIWDQLAALYGEQVASTSTGLNTLVLGGQIALTKDDLKTALERLKQGHKHILAHPDALGSQLILVEQALLKLADRFKLDQNYETATLIYQGLLKGEEASSKSDLSKQLSFMFLVADATFRDGQSLESNHYYEQALKLATENKGFELAKGKALFGIAEVYSSWNNHDEAQPFYKKALDILKAEMDPDDPELQQLEAAYIRNKEKAKTDLGEKP